MAIGDIDGDLATAALTHDQRIARLAAQGKQTSFDVTNTSTGPVSRAAQQLPAPASLAQGANPSVAAGDQSPPQVAQPQAPSSLSTANLVTPLPQRPQQPPMTNLAQVGSAIGTNLLNGANANQPTQTQTAPPVGPVPTATSPTVDPLNIQSVKDQNSLRSANMLANPTPVNPAAQPGSLSDQFRPTGLGINAQGGQIVARTGANGVPEFSNLRADQQGAQGLGQIVATPRPATLAPGSLADLGGQAAPAPSFASLGSAANLGDGVGAFSQANAGDAALAAGRFGRANEIRQGTQNQARLDQALGAQWDANHTNIVHDSGKPLTLGQQQSDQSLQQVREQAANKVSLSQGLINSSLQNRSGEQQLRQASRLEDLQAAAIAPNATPEAVGAYSRAIDPTGEKGLARQLTQANIDEKNAGAAKLRNTNKAGNLPVGLQKLEDGDIDAVSNVQSINTQMGNILGQIDDGSLVLGPFENRKNAARNSSGISTPQSANYASFMSSLEKIRNDSLRLNKGPQTEGDANRAWNELLSNVNDPKVVKQRLGEIQVMNNKAAQVRLGMINSRRKNQGVGPLNIDDILGAPSQSYQPTQQTQPQQSSAPAQQATTATAPTAQASGIPQIQNDDDFNKLPSGAQFIDPKGMHRRKP